jgi:hypothetical protein
VPAHEWTHVAVSYDGRQEYHYVAGQLGDVDPCGEGGSLAITADGFKIGARGASAVSQFQGDVDEAMLFSRALSPAEVDALYRVEYRSGGGMTNVYSAGAPDPNALPAGLDEGLLSLSLSNLLYMENPYSNKKCQ